MTQSRTATIFLGTVGAIVGVPLILWLLFMGWISAIEWQGTRVLFEHNLGEGEILRLTEIPATSPGDSTNSFKLTHRGSGDQKFNLINVVSLKATPERLDYFEDEDLLVVISPDGRTVHIHGRGGWWHHWNLGQLLLKSEASVETLLCVPGHTPHVSIQRVSPSQNEIEAVVLYRPSMHPQYVVFEYSASGESLRIKEARFPADPRPAYAQRHSLKSGDSVFAIVAGLDRSGIPAVLLSHSGAGNGRAGYLWTVFVVDGEAYRQLDELISLRGDALSRWSANPGFDEALTSYHPRTGKDGSLVSHRIVDGAIVVDTISVQSGESPSPEYVAAMREFNRVSVLSRRIP